MKILIVDNSRLFNQIISEVFVGEDLVLVAATSAEEALTHVAREEFAFVCSSYYLADMSGIELCRRLRQTPHNGFTPFVLLTAEQPLEIVTEAYLAGVTDIFEKRALDRLLTFIKRLLGQNQPIVGRVLLVEDSSALTCFYADILRTRGLEVVTTPGAEAALQMAAAEDFDLIVTDIVLGGPMSGVTLVNQVRRIEGRRGEVPILAITAFDDSARRVELFRLGVNDYVHKPVAGEELTARTRNLIAHWRLHCENERARRQAESERESAHRELAYRASHDALTDLANRWAFEQELATVLVDPERAAGYGLALIDIVSLRVVNDSYGREAGDAVLKALAACCAAAAPAGTLCARLEGSRLALLMPIETPGASGAAMAAVVEAIEAHEFMWGDCRMPIHATAGAVASLGGVPSVGAALDRVEVACAAARSSGARGLLVYSEDDSRILAREREKQSLPSLLGAIDGDQVALFMQRIAPLHAAAGGEGFEFLCRLVGRDGTLRLPGEFMPAAERYGLMPRLDRLVTNLALGWIAAHHRQHPDTRFFTINLSGQTLSDSGFCEFVHAVLQRTGAPVHKVYFEITETAILAEMDVALRFMGEMAALGCRFALDDFGSGTASFSQLKRLPVQMLKIDGQFVRGMSSNPVDLAIVRSTCEIARVMKLTTVAEFIESEDEARALTELGVDYGQGYALGRPAPAG